MATYYCATTGDDDTGDGTIGNPWKSWQKLGNSLTAGDTGYIRGGTYTDCSNTQYQCRWYNLVGTLESPINIWAYPGETPIWDFTTMPPLPGGGMQNFAIQMNQCDYVHVKGLRITNFLQQNAGTFIIGWNMVNSQHNLLENITVDHIGGNGFALSYAAYGQADAVVRNSEYNTYLNCDAHHCEDPYTYYENANGWNLAWDNQTANTWISHTTLRGCRSYFNSDDGFDMYGNDSPDITWINCWAFYNGYNDEWNHTGNGCGFKLGRTMSDMSTTHMYTLVNCISAHNTNTGFDQNVDPGSSQVTGIIWFYNCLAYDQYIGFSFYQPGENIVNVFRNNISYDNSLNLMNYDNRLAIWLAIQDDEYNSWNGAVTVTDADFESVDYTQLENARKSNGDLPDITFAHLAVGSDLLDAGVTSSYNGDFNDIGVCWVYSGANGNGNTISIGKAKIHKYSVA